MDERHDVAKAVTYKFRVMRAYVRYYAKYPPEVLKKMTIAELAEAFQELIYVRGMRSRYEAEE